jgi:hypothetical protein
VAAPRAWVRHDFLGKREQNPPIGIAGLAEQQSDALAEQEIQHARRVDLTHPNKNLLPDAVVIQAFSL